MKRMLLGGTLGGHAMAGGMQPWTKVALQGCGWTGGVGAGRSQNYSSSCNAPAKMRNALSDIRGSLPRSAVWVLTGLQQLPGCLQNSRWSIHPGLLSRRCWPASRQTRWMGAPFQPGRAPLTGFAVLECRFPLPYLVLGKKKKGLFCLSLKVPET